MYYYIMIQIQKRIINFDSIYSTKIDSNPFNTTFQLSETFKNISKIIISDLNSLLSGLQTSMLSSEICPVFSVSSTEINKLVMKCTLLSS